MTVLVFALAVAVMVAVHVILQRRLVAKTVELHEKLDGQADAQYKQAKHAQRRLSSTQEATARVSDEVARLLSDCRQIHEITQDMLREVRGNG